MNIKQIAFWISTGLFAFALGSSGLGYLAGAEMFRDAFSHLGYPSSLLPLLGLLKVAGVVALLAPGFAKLKEWAYAGFTFNLIGAAWAHFSVGDGAVETVMPLVLLGVLSASYLLRHESRKVTVLAGELATA